MNSLKINLADSMEVIGRSVIRNFECKTAAYDLNELLFGVGIKS